MMLKTCGLVLVFISSLIAGLELNKAAKCRIDTLEGFCKSLVIIHGELGSRPCSVLDLCQNIVSKSAGNVQAFYYEIQDEITKLEDKSFFDIWTQSVKEHFKHLKENELKEIEALGAVIGSFELAEQISGIENCKKILETYLQELKISYPGTRRLYLGVSCSLGAMLVLVLL